MANHTEQIGVHYCGMAAESNNWLFREQPLNDIGIDAHMEYVESSGSPKQLLAVQIKSGSSWFKEEKNGTVIFRDINERQFNYWTSNSLPCIVVLYNPEDKTCIWQKLTRETIERTNNGEGKGFVVKVPRTQIFLDSVSNSKLLSLTNLPKYITSYNFLLSQVEFMKILQNGGTIKLHSEEWVNKSSGRGDIKLIVNNGGKSKTYLYPYWFPFTPYTDVFPRLFPWAAFSADEDFYEDDDIYLWHELHCVYDDEEHEWVNVGYTFEEFRKKMSPIRSINHSGEVAEYMLDIELNELGKSFLMVNEFTRKNQLYAETRPQEELEG